PLTSAVTFQLVYLACGVIIVIALRALLLELGFSPAAATTGACIVAADPVLLSFENAATYEYPVAMLLVVSAWLCARYVRTRRQSTLIWFVVALTTVVLTRALLHPLWLIASVALLLFVVRPRISPRLLVVLAIPLVLIGGWMVKNQVVFGDATLSSW